jgi:hypothetical protein
VSAKCVLYPLNVVHWVPKAKKISVDRACQRGYLNEQISAEQEETMLQAPRMEDLLVLGIRRKRGEDDKARHQYPVTPEMPLCMSTCLARRHVQSASILCTLYL